MSLLSKGYSWTFFRTDCSTCYSVQKCLRASAFSSGTRQYLLGLKGFKRKPSAAMKAGTERHEKRQSDIKTLDEYGMAPFFLDLMNGRRIMVKEASVCSRFRGFRGHPDILIIQKRCDLPLTYDIEIVELKSGYMTEYFFQLVAYCLAFSDPLVELVWRDKESKKMKTMSSRLFPDEEIYLNIYATMEIFGQKNIFHERFMAYNEMTHWGASRALAVQKRAKSLRRYRKAGLYWVNTIPFCKYCKPTGESKCPFWDDICAPMGYKPLSKSRQLFWGKKKMLIKTKPKVT